MYNVRVGSYILFRAFLRPIAPGARLSAPRSCSEGWGGGREARGGTVTVAEQDTMGIWLSVAPLRRTGGPSDRPQPERCNRMHS